RSANEFLRRRVASIPLRAHVLRPRVADQQPVRVENRLARPVCTAASRIWIGRRIARIGHHAWRSDRNVYVWRRRRVARIKRRRRRGAADRVIGGRNDSRRACADQGRYQDKRTQEPVHGRHHRRLGGWETANATTATESADGEHEASALAE